MTSSQEDGFGSAEPEAPITDLAIDGELTLGTLAAFRTRVFAALAEAKVLKISLCNATYLDAAAFQQLWALRLEAEQRGITVQLDDPPPAVRDDAEALGMLAVFANVLHTPGTRDG